MYDEVAMLRHESGHLWEPRRGRDHVVKLRDARPSSVEPASHHPPPSFGHGHGPVSATLRTNTDRLPPGGDAGRGTARGPMSRGRGAGTPAGPTCRRWNGVTRGSLWAAQPVRLGAA